MINNPEASLIKRPHQATNYTREQVEEFRKCADPITGPAYFLNNFFYIQHPTRGRLLFKMYDYQLELLNTYHTYRQSISMLSRQLGKCLSNDINITVRNKKGEIYIIPIGVFYAYEAAKRDGTEKPDIEKYRQKR